MSALAKEIETLEEYGMLNVALFDIFTLLFCHLFIFKKYIFLFYQSLLLLYISLFIFKSVHFYCIFSIYILYFIICIL